jgi:hypothetical protein
MTPERYQEIQTFLNYIRSNPFGIRLDRQYNYEFKREKPTWSTNVVYRMMTQPGRYDSDVLNYLRGAFIK